jgi:NAD(P)-dependent dehydrogenase (short-subunit alcohol dehydrogenase family)
VAADDEGARIYLLSYAYDVTDWETSQACVRKITAEIGPVDVLVNNAGITRDMTFKKMDKINWDAVMHANLDSCFNMTKQVCDGMVDRNWGRIINISSVNGEKGAFGQTNYSAAKAGMHGFSKALALEAARKSGETLERECPATLKSARLHDLRHTFGRRSRAAEVGLEDRQGFVRAQEFTDDLARQGFGLRGELRSDAPACCGKRRH